MSHPFPFGSKRIEGVGIALQNWDEESEDQQHELGTIWDLNDGTGDKFAYARNGGVAAAEGLMMQSAAAIANHEEFVGGAGSVGALDSQEITIGQTVTTALTANQYDRGKFVVTLGTGIGQMWRIVSHTNSVTPVFQLASLIRTALATSSTFTIVPNKYADLIFSPAVPTGLAVGIPQIAVQIGFYFWAKIRGESPIKVDAGDTIVVGDNIGNPATAGGSGSGGVVGATDHVYGIVRSVAAASSYCVVDLNMPE